MGAPSSLQRGWGPNGVRIHTRNPFADDEARVSTGPFPRDQSRARQAAVLPITDNNRFFTVADPYEGHRVRDSSAEESAMNVN